MPEKSFNFVKVKYLEWDKIISGLRQAAHKIKQNANVEQVYLFGSLIRGNYGPGSDADICIVLKCDDRRFIDRIPSFLDHFIEVNISVDVFPFTRQEIEQMSQTGNSFYREILVNGVEL